MTGQSPQWASIIIQADELNIIYLHNVFKICIYLYVMEFLLFCLGDKRNRMPSVKMNFLIGL